MLPARRVVVTLGALVGMLALPACGRSSDSEGAAPSTTTTARVPRPNPGTPSPVDQVLPGQCFNEVSDPTQRRFAVLVIGCEEPHMFEVYDRFDLRDERDRPYPASASYPGETPVRTAAEQGCYDRFESWMGIPWTASAFDIQTYWPSATSWRRGDRVVTCTAYRFDGTPTTGTARGAEE